MPSERETTHQKPRDVPGAWTCGPPSDLLDGCRAELVLAEVWRRARSYEDHAKLVGDITAADLGSAIRDALQAMGSIHA